MFSDDIPDKPERGMQEGIKTCKEPQDRRKLRGD
jgi:hypothetical protein